eukprot:TRINITY_DN49471_c0_g1_i7.p1 TRINITY_DN49471_c0_g1~~TRINITY_DN49471_c0_g1_i7.p1  ORF type:complete len:334 (+),score=88.37 TRINITY_DN49471_c0_g1_i7:178-1179(+)
MSFHHHQPPPGYAERELERLRQEYRDLEAASVEKDVSDGVDMHDAQLLKLQLSRKLQRYREKPPSLEEVAEDHESELQELEHTVLRLRQENASLAFMPSQEDSEEQMSRGIGPGVGSRASGSAPKVPAARSASQELCDEVQHLWHRHTAYQRSCRRAGIEEWKLQGLQEEARVVMQQLKQEERENEELSARRDRGEKTLQSACDAKRKGELDLERERRMLKDLHAQVSGLREACYMPARLKRESSFLVRILDREGGRLKTRKHLQGLQTCKRLYDEVAAKAPGLLPLAGRVKTGMEALFTKYLRLEESHGRALQTLHLTVTRGLLRDGDASVL